MARVRATDRRLFLLLEIAARRLNRDADARLKTGAGVSASQAAVLFLLMRKNKRRMGEIGEMLSLNPPAVTGLISRMAKARLISRATDARDKRGALVSLTKTGAEAAERADAVLRDFNAELETRLGEDDSDALFRALTGLAARE